MHLSNDRSSGHIVSLYQCNVVLHLSARCHCYPTGAWCILIIAYIPFYALFYSLFEIWVVLGCPQRLAITKSIPTGHYLSHTVLFDRRDHLSWGGLQKIFRIHILPLALNAGYHGARPPSLSVRCFQSIQVRLDDSTSQTLTKPCVIWGNSSYLLLFLNLF